MKWFTFAVFLLFSALTALAVIGALVLFVNNLIGAGLACVVAAAVFALMSLSVRKSLRSI